MALYKAFIDYSKTLSLSLYDTNIFVLPGNIYTDTGMVYYAIKSYILNVHVLHTMRFWNKLHRVLEETK